MKKKTLIYFADLTHRGLVLSSNVFPLSIGLIAAYLIDKRPESFEVELFKYPEDLSAALEKRKPDIMAFANYSWNFHISYEYTRVIKNTLGDIPVIFGGPNYGVEHDEISNFWKDYGLIDFYIVREGEEAFVQLVDTLIKFDMDVSALRASGTKLSNCHYLKDGEVVEGPNLPRLILEDLPSPYLMGLMDKFFDESLGPMIHTTRGCPFKCAFCTEGAAYYNKVEQRMDNLADELHYIAQRVKGPLDLYISDANFGMFKQDVEKAELLADMQKQYGYPRYIHVSTGKNQKERVIEIAKKLDGAVSMAASLQSTDPLVLKNVSRSNISIVKLTDVGKVANKAEAGTYSEIILGLPGDSFEAHCQSLRDCVNANFDNIRMYQLIMLPQTELNTPASRKKFEMKSQHRVMPRSFGRYTLAGQDFVAVESEEILIENSTLPFDDYVLSRELDLTVELIHNGKIYEEIQGYLESRGLSWFDFILRFYKRRRQYSEEITEMYDDFQAGLTDGLWDTREELADVVKNNIDEMLNDERGTNEMSMGKATGFFILFEQINDILFNELKGWLVELNMSDASVQTYLGELQQFSRLRKMDLMNCDIEFVESFTIDIEALAASHFKLLPEDVQLTKPKVFKVAHLPDQNRQISGYIKEFGRLHDGMGKMLMRYPHVHRIFRGPQAITV